jgi:hypothetical protein
MKRKKCIIQTANIYTILLIAIIAVPRDFNASYNTLKIATPNTLKNDTLKTKIFNSVTLMTYKLRDTLFARNKAINLLNT